MSKQKKSTEAANFDADVKLNNFLNSFNSNPDYVRVQCLNCDVWTSAGNTVPTGIYDQTNNKIFVFRVCRDCRQSFLNVGDDLKMDFCNNLMRKAEKAEANI